MERAHAQWAHDQPAHAVRRQRSFQFRLVPALGQPPTVNVVELVGAVRELCDGGGR
jgi:hypothetical protein